MEMLATLAEFLFGEMSKEQRYFIMRTIWVGMVSFHICWSCGWLGVVGLAAPYATAGEQKNTVEALKSIEQQLKDDRLDRLQQSILQTRYNQCRTALDSPARSQYTTRLNELWNQYIHLSGGAQPRVPACDET